MPDTRLVSIHQCARCGGDHDHLPFSIFVGNPIDDIWNWWALCPTTGDPILLRNIQRDPDPTPLPTVPIRPYPNHVDPLERVRNKTVWDKDRFTDSPFGESE